MSNSNNTVLWEDGPSGVSTVGSFVFSAFASAAIGTGAFFYLEDILLAIASGIGMFILMSLSTLIYLLSTRYILTKERLRIRTGFFSRKTDDLELYRVKDYSLEEPLWLRMFGQANLILYTSDSTTPTVTLEGIEKSEELLDQIRQLVEDVRDRKGVRELDVGSH